jgi:hypothetical protein
MRSVYDGEYSVPAVFVSDDGEIRRIWLRVELADGEIACSYRVRHGTFEAKHTVSFYRTERCSLVLPLIAWCHVAFSRPLRLPMSRTCIQSRSGTRRRPRVSLTPPRPLDFTLHIYESPTLQVNAVLAALKVN